ncbi:MAG: LOG family protein [Candidatus Pacearchaeota archaeon]
MSNIKNDEEFERLLKEEHFRVTIFGSARIERNDPIYRNVFQLAKMIGERGIDLVTGGGPGIMEAATLGHKTGSKKTKAHSIGLGIKLPHEQKFNEYVGYKKEFNRFSSRLDNFMLLSNIVVVAPGGVGTLLELFYTWQLMQVRHICHIPIILLGDDWKGLLEWLKESPLKKGFFNKEDYELLFLVKSPSEAINVIDKAYDEYKKGNKDFCLNYKRYRV